MAREGEELPRKRKAGTKALRQHHPGHGQQGGHVVGGEEFKEVTEGQVILAAYLMIHSRNRIYIPY